VPGFFIHLCAVCELQHRRFGVLWEPERAAYEQRLWSPERPAAGHQPIRDANAQSTVLVKIGIGRVASPRLWHKRRTNSIQRRLTLRSIFRHGVELSFDGRPPLSVGSRHAGMLSLD